MPKVDLTARQSDVVAQHLKTAQLRSLITYAGGRLEAEFIDPETGRYRVDLTPQRPARLPERRRWTLVLLFGGVIWGSFWFLAPYLGVIPLPPILAILLVLIGVAAMVAGIYLAEQQLGTPLLLTQPQSKVLERRLERGATVQSIAGGGGTSVLGRGDVTIRLSDGDGPAWYVVSADGSTRRARA